MADKNEVAPEKARTGTAAAAKTRGAGRGHASGKTPAIALRRMAAPPSATGGGATAARAAGDGFVAEDRPATAPIGAEQREAIIREAAYYKAEKRNFEPGFETHDWVEAEREFDETRRKE